MPFEVSTTVWVGRNRDQLNPRQLPIYVRDNDSIALWAFKQIVMHTYFQL